MQRQRGFTLLEILISMTLFTVIGFAVVLLMRTGVNMWVFGNRGSQKEDRLEQSLPRLEEDLRHVIPSTRATRRPFDAKNPDPEKEPEPLVPDNRFLSSYVEFRVGAKTYRCRYLAFVRDIAGLGEIETYEVRAGTNSGAESYLDGKNDEEEFGKNDHLPTGGQVEVLWIWLPNGWDRGAITNAGVGTVYRAYRSPIGGKDTLLDPKNFDDFAKLRDNIKPQPMFQNVLLFDVYFWTQYTTTWEYSDGDPTVTSPPTDAAQVKAGRRRCGPSRTWDSTRGILAIDSALGFRLSHGKESARYTRDDIWPRMVRIEFALAEEETNLSNSLGAADTEFRVVAGDFATGRGDLYGQAMKIGAEWVQINGRDGRQRDVFQVDRRGFRNTHPIAHPEETPVYYGRLFDLTITIPAFRDDNN